MSARDQASKKIGDKLLAGWKMLGDCCNNCYSPLMQPRGSRDKMCVVCEPGDPTDAGHVSPGTSQSAQAPQRVEASTLISARVLYRAKESKRGPESRLSVPLASARVLPAPDGWERMTPEELNAAMQGHTGVMQTGAAGGIAQDRSAPAKPDVSAPAPASIRPDTVRLSAAQGNLGPRQDAAVELLPTQWDAPEPDAGMIARIEEGLRRAAEEPDRPISHPSMRTMSAPVVEVGWARRALQRAVADAEADAEYLRGGGSTTVDVPVIPVSMHTPVAVSNAETGLRKAIHQETDAINRLSAPDMIAHSADALAASADRLAKLIAGLKALLSLTSA